MRWHHVVTSLAIGIVTGAAHAQGLRCETTAGEICDVGGCRQERIFEVRQYPAEAHFQLTVTSADPRLPSTLLDARDNLLESSAALDTSTWNTSFQSTAAKLPLPLTYGFAYQAANLTISSYEACKTLAGASSATGPVLLDNRLVVFWEDGQAQCTSRVVCFP